MARSLALKELKVAIAGGTGGNGRALSRLLASRGAHVTVVGQTFRATDVQGINVVQADLSLEPLQPEALLVVMCESIAPETI